jgi:hypothetical protein
MKEKISLVNVYYHDYYFDRQSVVVVVVVVVQRIDWEKILFHWELNLDDENDSRSSRLNHRYVKIFLLIV